MLNIVLHEPEIPGNTGTIGRTCVATGTRLHLIEPLGFQINDKTLKRAGLDYWHYLDISYYDGLKDFFAKNQGPFYYFTTKGRHNYSEQIYAENAYLVFGREDKGLPEELLLQHPDSCLRLPMRGGLRSLNLSNTVAVGVYEALRQWGFPELKNQGQLSRYTWPEEPDERE